MSELLLVTEGRCPLPPSPGAVLVKAPLRIAGLLFCGAPAGSDNRGFLVLWLVPFSRVKQFRNAPGRR